MIKVLLSLILLLLFKANTYSQFINLQDSSMQLHRDTTLDPVSIIDTTYYPESDIDSLGLEIEKSIKTYWKTEFMNLISVNESDDKNSDFNSDIYYEKYSGKIIRNVDIRQLQVFGQTVFDTTQKPSSWIEKLGNKMHVNTQDKILRKKLFVQPGDSLNPFILADNERLIRDLPYIKNVQILLTEVDNDSVDVLFLAKDVFSLAFGFEIPDVSYGEAGIWNHNIFGIGHEFYYSLFWNYNKRHNYGHLLKYRVQNIRSTFINAEVIYENRWELEAFKVYLNRNFLTPEMKYAGGIAFENINNTIDIILPDTILLARKVDYDYIDIWLGRSFLLSHSYKRKKRSNIAITGRLMRYNFHKRPEDVSQDFLHNYHTRTMLLGGIGISSQAFYKSNLVYGFGKSEDIPYGVLLTFTAGLEKNEFFDRPYLGFSYSFGSLGSKFGLLFFQIEYGTFFNDGVEQGTLNLKFKTYSPLLNKEGRFNYRLFSKINYKTGTNRFEDEFIELDNNIRGLKSQSLRGTQLFNVNIESVCYSPHYLGKFRFLYFLFIDAGIINNKSKILTQNTIYSGFGAGVRIKNENLVFNTIEIRFSYYPVIPDNSTAEHIFFTGRSTSQLESFIIPKPDVLGY